MKKRLSQDEGVPLAEYILLVLLIVVAALSGMTFLGHSERSGTPTTATTRPALAARSPSAEPVPIGIGR
jgi:hypothetical protein